LSKDLKSIKVVVHGALGKMGQEIIKAICHENEIEIVGAVDLTVKEDSLPLPDKSDAVPLSTNLKNILINCQPDVLVDFTVAQASMPAVRTAVKRGVNVIIGTSGLSTKELKEINKLATTHQIGAVVAPNFALGAVLMIHLAKIASKYLNYAEIIEMHHQLKADAPSGTAILTAQKMVASRGKPFCHPPTSMKLSTSRGECIDGVAIHSIRLLGLLAHQEVLFGGPGQTLSIRHDTISRECFMPGIMLAIREVMKRRGLIYGLDALLSLSENNDV
jgi:4-hydroxy-tetrahydrodipicolinate reductase